MQQTELPVPTQDHVGNGEKDQKYIAKLPGKRDKFTKGNTGEKKFKRKSDTSNNNSEDTNGMHNNIPLTKEHQLKLGEGESKPTPGNPKGYSKRQIKVLHFFRDLDSKNRINNSDDDGNFSSWGWGGGGTNFFRNNRNVENKIGMAFNMFKPSDSAITPRKGPTLDYQAQKSIVWTDYMDG